MEIHVLEVDWREFAARLSRLREIVFIEEQNVPREEEWDGLDEGAHHFIAINELGQDLGCARLLSTGQIGRMAVVAQARGTGIGADLLRHAVNKAQALGFTEVFLHAQTHAVGFYEKQGFLAEGETYEEAGIPHQNMRRKLAVPYSGPATRVRVPNEPAVHAPQETIATMFDGEAGARGALNAGVAEARRTLVIYSHALDPVYFDQPEFAEVLSSFARRSRNAEARVLIQDSSLMVSRGHRVLELSRRLSSKIVIQQVDADYDPPDGCFVAWDQKGYWHLPDHREPKGIARLEDAVRAKRLYEEFDRLWRRARPDPNLRTLGL